MSHSTNAIHDYHGKPASTVEEDHVDLRGIFGFGIGLAVVTAIAHFAMIAMFWAMDRNLAAAQPPRVFPLAVSEDERQPPAPRLQTNPKQDLKDLRAGEDVVLNGYAWVDRNNKVVRIPVSEAMKLTLQRGLPARPQAADAQAAPAAATPATQDTGK